MASALRWRLGGGDAAQWELSTSAGVAAHRFFVAARDADPGSVDVTASRLAAAVAAAGGKHAACIAFREAPRVDTFTVSPACARLIGDVGALSSGRDLTPAHRDDEGEGEYVAPTRIPPPGYVAVVAVRLPGGPPRWEPSLHALQRAEGFLITAAALTPRAFPADWELDPADVISVHRISPLEAQRLVVRWVGLAITNNPAAPLPEALVSAALGAEDGGDGVGPAVDGGGSSVEHSGPSGSVAASLTPASTALLPAAVRDWIAYRAATLALLRQALRVRAGGELWTREEKTAVSGWVGGQGL
jgi:hypothetical protein